MTDAGKEATPLEPRRLTICLTSSHGGHLTELLGLREAFEGHDVFYFCYDAETTRALPRAHLVPNMARNPIEFAKNLARVFRIFRRERPDLVVSTGAEIALPVVLVAKLFRAPTVYIECGAQVRHPSFTGRVMHWLADAFYVQWPELLPAYGRRASMRGSLIDEDRPFEGDRSAEARMRAVLVHPAQEGAFSSDQPPMGLAYIASVLEQHGCDVTVVDAQVEGLTPARVARIIAQRPPHLVGVSVTTPALPAALELARSLHQLTPRPWLIGGGPHATVLPEDLLTEDGFDCAVRAEAEHTMAELAEALAAAAPPDPAVFEHVAGVSWRRGQDVVHNPDRAFCPDLDALPYPDWSLLPLRRYSSLVRRSDRCLPIMTSRGCPYGCTFCYKGVFGRKLRMRPPESVVDEWAFLVARYGLHEIAVVDDSFTFDMDRAARICELLIARGLDRVPWSTTNGIRVDRASAELFALMRRAGCYRVYFGIESGVQRVIDALDKGITLEQVRQAVALAKGAGLEVGGYFMLGNVGETALDMETTIRFALQLDLDYAQFSIATPYPGTKLYETVLERGRLLINSWDELATFGSLVFTAGDVTPDLVARKFRKAIRRFYFRPRFVARQLNLRSGWSQVRHGAAGAALVARLALSGGKRRMPRGDAS